MAVGPVDFLLFGGRCDLLKGAETGRGQARVGVPSVQVTLAGLPALLAFPLTIASSSPRKMYSSVVHLARANPFNAPHLQLVHDGLAGPRSDPAGPPGPPRRSRNLAAAAVEGEVRPCPYTVGKYTRGPLGFHGLARPGGQGRTRPALQDGAQLLCPRMSARSALSRVLDPWPFLKDVEGPRLCSLRDLHVLESPRGIEAVSSFFSSPR